MATLRELLEEAGVKPPVAEDVAPGDSFSPARSLAEQRASKATPLTDPAPDGFTFESPLDMLERGGVVGLTAINNDRDKALALRDLGYESKIHPTYGIGARRAGSKDLFGIIDPPIQAVPFIEQPKEFASELLENTDSIAESLFIPGGKGTTTGVKGLARVMGKEAGAGFGVGALRELAKKIAFPSTDIDPAEPVKEAAATLLGGRSVAALGGVKRTAANAFDAFSTKVRQGGGEILEKVDSQIAKRVLTPTEQEAYETGTLHLLPEFAEKGYKTQLEALKDLRVKRGKDLAKAELDELFNSPRAVAEDIKANAKSLNQYKNESIEENIRELRDFDVLGKGVTDKSAPLAKELATRFKDATNKSTLKGKAKALKDLSESTGQELGKFYAAHAKEPVSTRFIFDSPAYQKLKQAATDIRTTTDSGVRDAIHTTWEQLLDNLGNARLPKKMMEEFRQGIVSPQEIEEALIDKAVSFKNLRELRNLFYDQVNFKADNFKQARGNEASISAAGIVRDAMHGWAKESFDDLAVADEFITNSRFYHRLDPLTRMANVASGSIVKFALGHILPGVINTKARFTAQLAIKAYQFDPARAAVRKNIESFSKFVDNIGIEFGIPDSQVHAVQQEMLNAAGRMGPLLFAKQTSEKLFEDGGLGQVGNRFEGFNTGDEPNIELPMLPGDPGFSERLSSEDLQALAQDFVGREGGTTSFSPEDIAAVEGFAPQTEAPLPKLPRSPELLAANPEFNEILMSQLSPHTGALVQDAFSGKDPMAQEMAFSAAMHEAPDLFEPSFTGLKSEVLRGGKMVVTDPVEAQMYMQTIASLWKQRKIDANFMAKQIASLQDESDREVFPRPDIHPGADPRGGKIDALNDLKRPVEQTAAGERDKPLY